MNISSRLKEIRKALGFSQEKFAKEVGVDQRAISHWERGRNEPSSEALKAFCEKYNINLNWLLAGQGEMFFNPVTASITLDRPTNYLKDLMKQVVEEAAQKFTAKLSGTGFSPEEREKILTSPPGAMKMVFPDEPTLMPLVNDIRCGSMTTILSESTELIGVPPTWKSKGDFCVKIKGNSMRQEGIIEGMIVLIRKKPVPDSGDIILVYGYDTPEEVNGVLKKAKYLDDGTLILQNASGETLDMGEKYVICGKAVKWMMP